METEIFFQQIVIVFLPCVLSLAAIIIILLYAQNSSVWFWGFAIYAVILIVFWIILYIQIRRISDLASVAPPVFVVDKN